MITYSQRDLRWAQVKLGTSSYSIGQAGCLLSCIASMLGTWGLVEDYGPVMPLDLNSWLRENGGYWNQNLFVWRSIEPLGCRLVELINCAEVEAPVLKLYQYWRKGYAVILKVDSRPGGAVQTHYVMAQDPDLMAIMDPWLVPGARAGMMATYLTLGWNAARAIFQAAIYEITEPTQFLQQYLPGAAAAIAGEPEHQEELCLRTS